MTNRLDPKEDERVNARSLLSSKHGGTENSMNVTLCDPARLGSLQLLYELVILKSVLT